MDNAFQSDLCLSWIGTGRTFEANASCKVSPLKGTVGTTPL